MSFFMFSFASAAPRFFNPSYRGASFRSYPVAGTLGTHYLLRTTWVHHRKFAKGMLHSMNTDSVIWLLQENPTCTGREIRINLRLFWNRRYMVNSNREKVMAITRSERLIQISDEIVRRAEIICKITNPSKSTGDKDKNIVADMKRHAALVEEAIKSLRK